jgi:hypothetical protein
MSIQPPQGILNIPNATLRVGKLAVDSTAGFDTVFNNVERNTILLVDSTEYTETKQWDLKMPNIFVATFEIKGGGSSFNFRNTSNGVATTGYTLTFSGTTLTLKYGEILSEEVVVHELTTATIPDLDSIYGKVYLTYEKQHFTVTVDGTLVLTYKDTTTRTPPDGEYVNFFAGTGSPGFKNLKVVAGHFISDGTSNIAYVGGGEVAVGKALAFNRVSNVSQIKVDSNVVAEYTGPHDRPLRKYPEVELDVNAMTSPGVGGYIVTQSGQYSGAFAGWTVFGEEFTTTNAEGSGGAWIDGSPGSYAKEAGETPNGVVGSVLTTVQNAGTLKLASNTPVGAWVSLELPTSIKLQRIEMRPRLQHASETDLNEVALQSFPREFGIWGYDGSNWVLLKSVTGHSAGSAFGYTPTHVNATTAYNKYAIVVTRTNAVGGSNSDDRNFTAIGQLYFYGYEEGSGSLDTTLKSVYNVPATTGTQLEVYYDAKDLADGAVTSVEDLSPNSNGGLPSDSPQISNGAFVFDGVNDYIYNSQSGYTSGNTYTGSAWIKKTSNTNGCVFQFGNGSNGNSFGIFYYGGTIDYVRAYVFGYALANSNSGSIPLNEWIHVTGVYSGKTATLYINGIEVATNTGSTDITIPSTPYLTIGAQTDNTNTPYTGTYFTGSIANFRLYSKALNADQVKELYEYQKDYFLGSKSQVTLYKGHLGVGVTEPSGQLELVGDERIQQYPPRAMTGYETLVEGHGVFCVSASTWVVTTYEPYFAFDNNDSTAWLSAVRYDNANGSYTGSTSTGNIDGTGTLSGEWLQISLPSKIFLKRSGWIPQGTTRGPKTGVILGSNNGSVWNTIHSFSDKTYSGTIETELFSGTSSTAYQYFRIIGSTIGAGARLEAREWKLFGTPGPTTLDKGSLSLGRSLDVPRISRYDVDTETPRPEKLVVDFDTTVNSSPTDISGRGNHGTFNGTNMNYSSADKAFVFNGTNDYIEGTQSTISGNNPYSFSVWVKPDSHPSSGFVGVFEMGTRSGDDSIGLYFDTGNIIHLAYGNNLATTTPTPVGNWTHIIGTYTSGDRKVYANGVLLGQDTYSGLTLAGTKLVVGANSAGTQNFDGQISNFKLYSVALEPSEVQKLYRLGRTGRSMVISDTAVGIGKAPEAQLDVRGTLRSDGLTVGGDIYATGNITGYSDRRAKSDIEKIENALEKIEQLNGYTFTMKGKRYTGLIAQEILPILPEAVSGSEETNYAVAYGNMMGLIVEAIKELKQKIG